MNSSKPETRTEAVVRKLRAVMPKRWDEIAHESGVPISTIKKIAYRETEDPRASTVDQLFDYFDAHPELATPEPHQEQEGAAS